MYAIQQLIWSVFPRSAEEHANLNRDKTNLIHYACRRFKIRSFVDLGGVWNVNGGYSRFTLDNYQIDRAVLVDTNVNEEVRDTQQKYATLELIEGNFGEPEIAERVGNVDAALFFDTLVHQVKPDWDDVLSLYANRAPVFLIYNPQYTGRSRTTRLLDLGKKEYFENVPVGEEEDPYRNLFEKLDQIHPEHQRPYRDIHNIWQWGITDDDLINQMKQVGFSLRFFKNCGQLGELRHFENHAFIFSR